MLAENIEKIALFLLETNLCQSNVIYRSNGINYSLFDMSLKVFEFKVGFFFWQDENKVIIRIYSLSDLGV